MKWRVAANDAGTRLAKPTGGCYFIPPTGSFLAVPRPPHSRDYSVQAPCPRFPGGRRTGRHGLKRDGRGATRIRARGGRKRKADWLRRKFIFIYICSSLVQQRPYRCAPHLDSGTTNSATSRPMEGVASDGVAYALTEIWSFRSTLPASVSHQVAR